MQSLNDLDALIAAAEAEQNSSASESESISEEHKLKPKKKRNQGPKENKILKKRENVIKEDDGDDDEEQQKKKRKISQALCFKYLAGSCTFEDCTFKHEKLNRLDDKEKIQMMQDLRKRPYEEALALKIRELNIPKCKDFAKKGECRQNERCRFWHLDNKHISKWAGFPFYCEYCWKPLTSQDQKDEHEKAPVHLNNVKKYGGGNDVQKKKKWSNDWSNTW